MASEKKKSGMRLRDKAAYALSTARGVAIEYDLQSYEKIVAQIRAVEVAGKSITELNRDAKAIRERIRAGVDLEDELAPVFALAAEACRSLLGMRPFDEQLVAGIVMHRGKLAQMQTGEGKTLAAVFPACLHAMTGIGVHVLTANDYLAHRDAEWMRPVYDCMGLRAASIGARTAPADRKAAYGSDVTYLTAREAGFDYLRDGLCYDACDIVHRSLGMAIVDEADFILIDEARVPLVLAGAAAGDAVDPRRADEVARTLRPGRDYTVDREGRRIALLLPGHGRIEQEMAVAGIHEERGAACFARVYAALHARELLRRDVDYIVKDGRIELVDEFTGRIADRRQWPWGVQAALEAKEGVRIRPEGRVFGSITIQHFMALYQKIAAMTATAVPSAEELAECYGLATVIIPTVKPVRRVDKPDVVFAERGRKMAALVREIADAHARGRPVLVGTGSVRESEELARLLRGAGVDCEVLNASNDAREAELIARAGRWGAVTISTNMAGRGTDIRLQGDGRVFALGGLYVIGTNRHESRRVDDQLRGRSGRQGEPGSSRFFVSLEDPLFERYGVREFLPQGYAADDPRVLKEINRAQSIIEAQHHSIRRSVRKYALLVELDRRQVRALRDHALHEGRLPDGIEQALALVPDARPEAIAAFFCLLDHFWADHLLLVEEVREGIDLERYAGREPGLEYIHRVGGAFDEGLEAVELAIVSACARRADDPDALRLDRLGTQRPSSTWTYQIDDAAPVRFNLALMATSNIGAAALMAGPLLLLQGLVSLAERLAKRLGARRRGSRGRQ
ncbi:MAG: DEAD/DEAH box helicase [Spirochaetia bacterium]